MSQTLSKTKTYFDAYRCVRKQLEERMYTVLSCSGAGLTFLDFKGYLHPTNLTATQIATYSASYKGDLVKLGAEIPYDIPQSFVDEFIEDVEACTGGRVAWLVSARLEVCGWVSLCKIKAAFAADPLLSKQASIFYLA